MNILSRIFGGKSARPASTASSSTGLYVDIENLQEDAKTLVGALLESWPRSFPRPGLVTLYVPADQAELWRMWGITRFKDAQVRVRGIQRFAGHLSKNSADLAIAADAISDFVRDRVGHVAVFSDDSDFMSLYVKIREESGEGATGETPFLWVLTDRRGTKSLNIRRYFPNEHIFVVRSGGQPDGPPTRIGSSSSRSSASSRSGPPPSRSGPSSRSGPPSRSGSSSRQSGPSSQPPRGREPRESRESREPRQRRSVAAPIDPAADRAIAEAIVERMAVGYFKSTDCQSLVRNMYPDHPLAHASSGVVGQRFVRHILPILLEMGVTEPNPNRRPRRFQITEESKDRLRSRGAGSSPSTSERPGASNGSSTSSDPTGPPPAPGANSAPPSPLSSQSSSSPSSSFGSGESDGSDEPRPFSDD